MPDTLQAKSSYAQNILRNEKITTSRVDRQRETEKELYYVIIGLRPSARRRKQTETKRKLSKISRGVRAMRGVSRDATENLSLH